MNLLEIVNEVCDVVSLDRFDSVYSTNDPNAQTMVALATEAGAEIARRGDWQRMLKEHTVEVGTPDDLPEDFQRLQPGGAVRSADGMFFRPVLNGSQWAVISQVPSAQPYFYIIGNQIRLSPAASAPGAVVDYVSKNWILGDPAAERDQFEADNDTTLFPERLLVKGIIWRWRRQKGMAYDDNLAEFEADLAQEINADRGAA
ncbi:MAG: hypothetical protein QHC90_25275 [Shinella sp.]|nr:hypothetical protein [Shinella sp.]